MKNNAERATLYMARNKITDDFYIGYTSKKVDDRKCEHLRAVKYNKRNNYFYNAIKKYGADNFIWTKIGELPSYKEGLAMEVELIAALKPAYNIAPGGNGVIFQTEESRKKISDSQKGNKHKLGKHHSEETRKKISNANRGRILSAESRLKISKAKIGVSVNKGAKRSEAVKKQMSISRTGMIMSEAQKEKIRIANTGKKRTDETKRKLSLAHAGKKMSSESIEKIKLARSRQIITRESIDKTAAFNRGRSLPQSQKDKMRLAAKKRKIICIEDNKVFDSIKETALFYNASSGNIAAVCANRKSCYTAKGKTFKYLEEV